MKRRDAKVLAISAGLSLAVVAAVVYSFVLDRRPVGPEPGNSSSSLLTLTWGPSLCMVDAANAGCKSGHVGRMGQSLVLHGLWPQPSTEQYCGVPQRGADRRTVDLPDGVRKALQDMMSDETIMAPHEWYAHGTCSGVAPAEYFGIATTLAAQVRTLLDPVFVNAGGEQLSPRAVRESFDAEFGGGAGKRVGLTCKDVDGQSIAYEVHLSLPSVKDLLADQKAVKTLALGDSLVKGPAIPPGCGQGRVPS